MPEDKDVRSGGGTPSLDTVLKFWPVVVAIICLVFAFGRKDDKTDLLIQQNGELRAMIVSLTEDMRKVSERLARVEAIQDANQRNIDQDKAYRDQLKR